MDAFYIVPISLWFYPAISYGIFAATKNNLSLRWQIVKYTTCYTIAISLCLALDIATTSFALNTFLLFSLYFTVTLILKYGTTRRNLIIRSGAYIVMVFVLIIGYISSTIGLLGVGMVFVQYEPTKTITIKPGVVYKEYRQGNAISDWRGTELTLSRHFNWLPFIEHKFFDKQYTDIITGKNGSGGTDLKHGIYTRMLDVKYDAHQNALIVADTSNKADRDTLFLDKIK